MLPVGSVGLLEGLQALRRVACVHLNHVCFCRCYSHQYLSLALKSSAHSRCLSEQQPQLFSPDTNSLLDNSKSTGHILQSRLTHRIRSSACQPLRNCDGCRQSHNNPDRNNTSGVTGSLQNQGIQVKPALQTWGLARGFACSTESPRTVEDDVDTVDCVVIGAGVIGMAVARALSLRGLQVVLLEAAGAVGSETSSRHSEVIHAGIYYPLGSLKARLCVEGKAMLYDYCHTHNVPYKNITKLIVATSKDQLPELAAFRATAARHGVPDLALLSGPEARDLEPALACEGALLSPSTGILDSHTYMASLIAEAQLYGATLALHTRLAGGYIEPTPHTPAGGSVPYKVLELHTSMPAAPGATTGGSASVPAEAVAAGVAGGGGPDVEVSRLRARWVVNAAGLHAIRVAASVAGLPRSSIPRLHLAKGNYFSLAGRCPFSRLIYPLPERGLAGLGTHLTLDMAGGAKFGPDVEWLPDPGPHPAAPVQMDYRVDARRAEVFYPAIRRYFPALQDGALQPSYSGVRPKLSGPGEPPADFMVQGAAGGHGVRGWVNLYGIESPGLTSSLALAEYVCKVLES